MAKRSKDDLEHRLIDWNYDRWERVRRHAVYRELWNDLKGLPECIPCCLNPEREAIEEKIKASFGIESPLDPYQEYSKEIFSTPLIFENPGVAVEVIPANPFPGGAGERIKGDNKGDNIYWEKLPFWEWLREDKYLKLDIAFDAGIILEQLLYQIESMIRGFKLDKAPKNFLKDLEANGITMCELRKDGHLILEVDLYMLNQVELLNQIKQEVVKHFKGPEGRFSEREKYYKAWDLKQEGKTYPEIAKILWPEDYAKEKKKNQPINMGWNRIPTDDEYERLMEKKEECDKYAKMLMTKGMPYKDAYDKAEIKFGYKEDPSKKSHPPSDLIVRACHCVTRADELIRTAFK